MLTRSRKRLNRALHMNTNTAKVRLVPNGRTGWLHHVYYYYLGWQLVYFTLALLIRKMAYRQETIGPRSLCSRGGRGLNSINNFETLSQGADYSRQAVLWSEIRNRRNSASPT